MPIINTIPWAPQPAKMGQLLKKTNAPAKTWSQILVDQDTGYIIAMSTDGPYYSLDNGVTWTACTFASFTPSGTWGKMTILTKTSRVFTFCGSQLITGRLTYQGCELSLVGDSQTIASESPQLAVGWIDSDTVQRFGYFTASKFIWALVADSSNFSVVSLTVSGTWNDVSVYYGRRMLLVGNGGKMLSGQNPTEDWYDVSGDNSWTVTDNILSAVTNDNSEGVIFTSSGYKSFSDVNDPGTVTAIDTELLDTNGTSITGIDKVLYVNQDFEDFSYYYILAGTKLYRTSYIGDVCDLLFYGSSDVVSVSYFTDSLLIIVGGLIYSSTPGISGSQLPSLDKLNAIKVIINNSTILDALGILATSSQLDEVLSDSIGLLSGLKTVIQTTIPAASWEGESAPYYMFLSVSSISSSSYPDIFLDLSSVYDPATGIALKEAWSLISKIITQNESLYIVCNGEKPTIDIPIFIKGGTIGYSLVSAPPA